MIRLGIIGLSEGNGHPYSFSAIINGYNDEYMRLSGWDNIYVYLKERDSADFGIEGTKVTHIWTQSIIESDKISKASNIDNIVNEYIDMINDVDGVIIARDDYKSHREIAKPFLEADKFVFIDKPLSLDIDDIKYFLPYLKNNRLMSCSGIRYAPELDKLRRNFDDFGVIKLVRGTIVKDWEKYAIHMLDGIFSIIPFDVKSVKYNRSNHESFTLFNFDGSIIEINALGNSEVTLRIEFYSDKKYYRADTINAFDSFRRTLWHFVDMIKNDKEQINTNLTINLMKILIAGMTSRSELREVSLSDINI